MRLNGIQYAQHTRLTKLTTENGLTSHAHMHTSHAHSAATIPHRTDQPQQQLQTHESARTQTIETFCFRSPKSALVSLTLPRSNVSELQNPFEYSYKHFSHVEIEKKSEQ